MSKKPMHPLPELVDEPKTTIVSRAKKKDLEPYMIPAVDKLIRGMLPMNQIPGMLGVSIQTFKRWLTMGEDEACSDPLYQEFAYVVHRARSEMNQQGVDMLKAHAISNPKALMDLLRVVDPDTWVTQQKVKVEKNVTHTAGIDLSRLTDEEIDEYESLLRIASGE